MRILVHDYCGHPGQIQVARELARMGHQVRLLYSSSFQTPHGQLGVLSSDPRSFDIEGLSLRRPFQKHSLLRRQIQEFEYGRVLARACADYRPDVVLCANTPLFALGALQRRCRRKRIPFIFWMTDIYSLAVHETLRGRWLGGGDLIGRIYRWYEGYLLRRSSRVIVLSEDFLAMVGAWGCERERFAVIPVCAPLDEVSPQPKCNAWAKAMGLESTVNLVYSGTLGHKHDPDLLLRLARQAQVRPDYRVVVISEGPCADELAWQRAAQHLDHLMVLPFQPFERLPEVLGSADVLLTILEPSAGGFSVPSKVLTHLCAGRAQVAAVPRSNAAARVIAESHGGVVVDPERPDDFVAAVLSLAEEPARRQELGRNGRSYAEGVLNVRQLCRHYEAVLDVATIGQPAAGRAARQGAVH